VKRLLILVSLAAISAVLLLFEVTDTKATTRNDTATSEVGEANNPSASATITITMTTAPRQGG
jgi:hypothetical protein